MVYFCTWTGRIGIWYFYFNKTDFFLGGREGSGYSLVVGHLPNMCDKVLSSSTRTIKKNNNKKPQKQNKTKTIRAGEMMQRL